MSFRFLCIFCVLVLSSQCKQNDQSDTNEAELAPANSLFKKIDASTSGLNFVNYIEENYINNIITNPYLYNGGGVAVIDYNHDGLEDLFFSSTAESCQLYQNLGNLKFENVTQKAGFNTATGIKTGVSVADINQDGWEDIYICRTGLAANTDRANMAWINQKNGTFIDMAPTLGIADISASNQAAFFDYDLDGDLDLYLLNHPSDFGAVASVRVNKLPDGSMARVATPRNAYESDKLYRNEGAKFTDVSKQAGIVNSAFGLSVTITDMNQDGWPDIIVGNDYIEPDFVYINQKGIFIDRSTDYFKHFSSNTMGADMHDFNNDGLLDFIALDMLPKAYPKQKRLETSMKYDRYNTLVGYGYKEQFLRNVLQINNGNGTYSDLGCIGGVFETDWSWSPLGVDFDLDGKRDLFITNGFKRNVTDLDYIKFTIDSIEKAGGVSPTRMKDINDYLNLIPSEKLRNFCYKNTGDLCFEDVSVKWGFTQKAFSNGSAVADLDNDGDMDLIINHINDHASIYQNTSSDQKLGHYLNVRCVGAGPGNKFAVGAKIQAQIGDRLYYSEVMPVRGFFSTSSLLCQIGLGAATQVDLLEVEFLGKKLVQMRNVGADQVITISEADAKPGVLSKLCSRQGTFLKTVIGPSFKHVQAPGQDFLVQRLLPWRISDAGACLVSGDVNGDGLADMYIGGGQDQAGALYMQQAAGNWTLKTNSVFEADKMYLDAKARFFDADSDGDLDLVVGSGGAEWPTADAKYQARLYLNDGKGNYSKSDKALPFNAPCASLLACDMDGDKDLDLLIGEGHTLANYPNKMGVTCLRNDGNGGFTNASSELGSQMQSLGKVTDMVLAELQGGGAQEIVIVGEWMPIMVFQAQGNQWVNISASLGLTETDGLWNTVQAADMNGDGTIDLVAGNLGLNTRYKASVTEPMLLYGSDFDRNGALDPIMCFTEKGKEFPFAYRDVMVAQIPAIKKKFIRYNAYAHAAMSDFFPPETLSKAEKSKSTILASSIFYLKNGKFEGQALPNLAQVSCTYGMAITDLNRDGKPDLVLAGNDFGHQTETGRLDSGTGVVLINEGATFKPIRSLESGFWADAEVRDIKVVTVGKSNQIWVANHNGPLQVFQLLQ
jgi:enediyne biosynthesis protein E4